MFGCLSYYFAGIVIRTLLQMKMVRFDGMRPFIIHEQKRKAIETLKIPDQVKGILEFFRTRCASQIKDFIFPYFKKSESNKQADVFVKGPVNGTACT